jgi:hypothetical protein
MDGKKLKAGCYVKWDADRMFKAWNTYGKVLKISKGQVTIVTYDDFKETTVSRDGDSVTNEMVLSTKQAVEEYIAYRKAELIHYKSKIEIEYKKAILGVDEKIGNLNNIEL